MDDPMAQRETSAAPSPGDPADADAVGGEPVAGETGGVASPTSGGAAESPAVEAVLFDLDDTVWEYRRTKADLLAVAFERVGVEPCFAPDDYRATMRRHLDDVDEVAELRRRCFGDLVSEAGHDRSLGAELAAAYTDERDYRDVRLLPGARETLDALAETYRLAAVTNGARVAQEAKFDELDLDDAFECVVYAGEDALAKPDPEPFAVALDELGVPPERAVHVGNSLTNDVVGARRAGIRSVWVPREESGVDGDRRPDFRVDDIGDLRDRPWE